MGNPPYSNEIASFLLIINLLIEYLDMCEYDFDDTTDDLPTIN